MTKRLFRSKNDSMLAGICGGIAEYFDLDPTLIRLAFIVLSILSVGFPGLLVYIILWIVIPQKD